VRSLGTYVLAAGSEVEILEAYRPFGTAALDLIGNEFGNTITGNDGRNTIGNDTNGDGIEDYDGLDVMTGNGGADGFAWAATAETGVAGNEADLITDSTVPKATSSSSIQSMQTRP